MDEAKLQALLDEVTLYSRDDEETLFGLLVALQTRLSFPLQAQQGGQVVTLVGLDPPASGLPQGVVAKVESGGQAQNVPLSGLNLVDADAESMEWMEAYRLWIGKRA